jgi:hypothetical protein
MQVVTPGEGTYDMPITWYFAPDGAKRLDCVNAFVSGIWDRDSPAVPPVLGEQPPYQFPFYNGKNVWGYRGLCRIGTNDQFAGGLTQQEATGTPPAQDTIPDCCRPQLPPPVPPPVFDCPFYPEGLPGIMTMQIFQGIGDGPMPDPAITLAPVNVPYVGHCTYFVLIPGTGGDQFSFNIVMGLGGAFQVDFGSLSPDLVATWRVAGHWPTPSKAPFFVGNSDGTAALGHSYVYLVPYPEDIPLQPIIIGGDVIGTGYPVIPTSLITIVTPGTAGDATHVPVITWDGKGRITGVTQVAIASGGPSIGAPVSGGTPNAVLFVDVSGNLADAGAFQFDGTNVVINGPGLLVTKSGGTVGVFSDGTHHVLICNPFSAGRFQDGVNVVQICDGTNAITYQWGGGSPAWGGTPPTDVWVALDRLAAWMAANFPGLPGP